MTKVTDPILEEKFPQREPWDTDDEAQAEADAEPDEIDEAVEAKQRETYPDPLTYGELLTAEFPPKRFLIENLIVEGIPQTLDGDGGVGKSLTAEGLSVGRASGMPIFGKATIQGPVLFVTHEDDYPDVVSGLKAYADYLGADPEVLSSNLKVWSLQEHDMTLANVKDDGSWTKGPFYATFEKKLKANPGAFVVLDCRSDVVQMNEFLREPPNTFYKTVLTPLCKRYGVTILVLCHPSKASMSDGSWYSGGTGNKSALRNKLVMKLADPKPNADPNGPRLFGVLKRNKGKRDDMIVLTFDKDREIFVAGDDATVRVARETMHGTIIEKIRTLIKAGVRVQIGNTGHGHGPREVAAALIETGVTVTEKEVKAAMKAALARRELGYREAAPGSAVKAGFKLDPDPIAEFDDENPSDFEPGS
jgi:RecA-family ATPase